MPHCQNQKAEAEKIANELWIAKVDRNYCAWNLFCGVYVVLDIKQYHNYEALSDFYNTSRGFGHNGDNISSNAFLIIPDFLLFTDL